jgi:glycosyltransferase involved in cell wall biosynthesis
LEIRDIWPLTLMSIGGLSKRNPAVYLLRKLEIFGYKNADIIVGTMPKLDDHIKFSIGSNFRFEWLPTGVDVDESIIAELPDMVARQIPKNKFIAAYTGALGKVNCVNEIVEAASYLNENDNIHFIILGNGPLKQALIEQAMGLDNVTFIEKIDKMYVQTFLSYCSVLLHPVMDKEIYKYGISPNKWIDYMLSGKPIIVSYSGHQSLINQANCGVFIPAQNPKLLSDEILKFSKMTELEISKMGIRGKIFVKRELNYEKLSNKYLNIILD